uniref:Ig-like domain-containing protein n=1 Tax=Gadus morhua TaxID=8049 RepID=A0A8C5ARW0_GADMO
HDPDIKVYQTADLEVIEGDSVTLHCCWTAVNHTHYRAVWRKNVTILHQQTAVKNDGEGCGSALSPVNNVTCGCAALTLPNVTRNHTGRYICQVSINKPTLIQFCGNGTMITVRERRSNEGTFSLPQRLDYVLNANIVNHFSTPLSDHGPDYRRPTAAPGPRRCFAGNSNGRRVPRHSDISVEAAEETRYKTFQSKEQTFYNMPSPVAFSLLHKPTTFCTNPGKHIRKRLKTNLKKARWSTDFSLRKHFILIFVCTFASQCILCICLA